MNSVRVVGKVSPYGGWTEGSPPHPFANRTQIMCSVNRNTVANCGGDLKKLVDAGMAIARFNLAKVVSDDDWQWLESQVDWIRKYEKTIKRPIAIEMDLGGMKLRIGPVAKKYKEENREAGTCVVLKKGQRVVLTLDQDVDPEDCGEKMLQIVGSLQEMPAIQNHGDKFVLLGDDGHKLRIVSSNQKQLGCIVESTCTIHATDGVTFRGIDVDATNIDDDVPLNHFPVEDRDNIGRAVKLGVDIIGVSFASPKVMSEIHTVVQDRVRERTRKVGYTDKDDIWLVAKIETPSAAKQENIEALLDSHANGVMIARGDLATSLNTFSVPSVQARIISTAIRFGKPAIVATGLLAGVLESGKNNHPPRIARAEMADIYGALASGADVLMLSETTKYCDPPALVKLARNAIIEAESRLHVDQEPKKARLICGCPFVSDTADTYLPTAAQSGNRSRSRLGQVICQPALDIANCVGVGIMVVSAASGRTVTNLSRTKPRQLILALTTEWATARRLLLCRGVLPVVIKEVPAKKTTKTLSGPLHTPERFVSTIWTVLSDMELTKEKVVEEVRRQYRKDGRATDDTISAHLDMLGMNSDLSNLETTVVGIMRADFLPTARGGRAVPNTIHVIHFQG